MRPCDLEKIREIVFHDLPPGQAEHALVLLEGLEGLVATAGSDGVVRIFDATAGGELVTMTGHRGIVNQVDWSPDGRRLASVANDRSVRVWDAATGRQVTEMGHDDYATAVAWSPDGELLASAGNDRTIRIWSAAGGELLSLLRGHSNGIGRLAWSPDGGRLASASVDRTVRIWDPLGGHADCRR